MKILKTIFLLLTIIILIPVLLFIFIYIKNFYDITFGSQWKIAKYYTQKVEGIANNSQEHDIDIYINDIFDEFEYVCTYGEYDSIIINNKKYLVQDDYIGLMLIKKDQKSVTYTTFIPEVINIKGKKCEVILLSGCVSIDSTKNVKFIACH